ncbi:hypothetical protein AALO_G00280850 [Alosa alosa]|uniref:Uncharacterized protein n=1 Tax=Alosa alosa TaxID=278164 RepID=A0AAV6FJC7_9TELE|nr:hypothetical protein AALO_G00280850 [Alosa alosa]
MSPQPERIIWFIAQVLDEVSLLLDENVTAVAWDQKKLKDFMSTLDTQLVATQSCEDKSKAWELIRKEVHHHLTKVDLLASTRL